MTRPPLRIFISHPSQFLTDSEPHGDGLLAHALLSRLAERGHTLHIALSHSELKKPLAGDVHLHTFTTLRREGLRHLGMRYRVEYALRVRRLFGRLRRTQAFDVIHQLNPVVGGLSLLLRDSRTPLLLGPVMPLWGDLTPKGAGKHVKEALFQLQCFGADGILAPTGASAARVSERIRSKERVFHFPLGIDSQHFDFDDAFPQTPTVLFLGNLQRRKGIFVLLDAFERLAERLPDARLIVAGGGWDVAEVHERVLGSAHRARIEMLGNIPREDVPNVLRTCTVYCLPSFGEPYGLTALEAMCIGRPLVVTATGGLGELVPDRGALKVAPGDAGALADALERVLRDPAAQRTMGAFNRTHVMENHAWDRVIDRLEDVYRRLAARGAHRHSMPSIRPHADPTR